MSLPIGKEREDLLSYLYGFNGTQLTKEGILYLFYTDKAQYTPGQSVRLTLLKVNTQSDSAVLTYPTSQYYDFFVRNQGDTVWHWAKDKFFLQAIQKRVLLPGEMYVAQEEWRIPENARCPEVYSAEGLDKAYNGVLLTVNFEIIC